MKSSTFTLALTASSLLLFSACKKQPDDSVYESSFYKIQDKGNLFLYINGVNKGKLPYFPSRPQCGERNTDGATPIKMQLKSGEYLIEGRDSLGAVRTCSRMFISRKYNSLSGAGCSGGAESWQTDDCLIYGMME